MSISLSGEGDLNCFFIQEENKMDESQSPCQSGSKKIKRVGSGDLTPMESVIHESNVFGNFKGFPSSKRQESSSVKSTSGKSSLEFNSIGIKRKVTGLTKAEPNKKAKLTGGSISETDNNLRDCVRSNLFDDFVENDPFIMPALPIRMPQSPYKAPPTPRKSFLSTRVPEFAKAPPTPRKGLIKQNDDFLRIQKEIEYQKCLEKYTLMPDQEFLKSLNGNHFIHPSPCKQINEKFITDKKVLEVSRKSVQALINDKNRLIEFESGDLIGKGSFCNVYELSSKSPQIYSTHENKNLVFKRFQEIMALKLGNRAGEFLNSMMEQYEALKKLNVPVVQILNNPREDKFFIMERLSMFQISWDEMQEPSFASWKQLAQVKKMIAIAKEYKIDLDLQPSNVGIDANGKVILFDFREEEVSGDLNEYLVSINKAIASFSNGNKAVKNFLRP